ncbi:MAG: hypothetical protein AMXMBFR64_11630 [Myxococcales bacterium]
MMTTRLPLALLLATLLTSCAEDDWGGPDGAGAPVDTTPGADAADTADTASAADAADDSGSDAAAPTDGSTADTGPADTADSLTDATGDVALDAADAPDAGPEPANPDCDPLDPFACALPWPSSQYLAPDPTRPTGVTLTFGPTTLPANGWGVHIDPQPYRRMDGYGPGTPLLVRFERLDDTSFPGEYDTDASLAADAPLLWFEVDGDTLVRVPYWAELDAGQSDPARKLLMVHPAVILKEATRYIVAFRGLKDTDGAPIAPGEAFAALRDGMATGPLAARQARFDDLLSRLEAEGVPRASLTLAWDFNTASSNALHGRMLHMRDEAFEATGPQGPELTITAIDEFSPEQNEHIAVELRGTFRAPSFLDEEVLPDGTKAYRFHEGPDGMPAQSGWREEDLWIRIPRTALDGTPHGLVHYGHGQNGMGDQVRGSFNSKIAAKHHLIFFSCNMLGMSSEDVPMIIQMLLDVSDFPWMADRLHQGMVNHLLLARAMRERFPSLAEVTDRGVVVNQAELYYSGISQGGIYGATYVALSQDVERGHLGVPGNNYPTLLFRSGNFAPFFAAASMAYPERTTQVLLVETVGQLWSAADPVSYMRHITAEPFPGNGPHHVMLVPAKGDPQVAVITNEIAARSDIGIPIMAHYDTERVVQGAPEQPYPHVGSGVVLYQFGNPWPDEKVNTPPTSPVADPHELPRKLEHHNDQMVHFFRTGEIIDVCGGDGCTPD